MATKHDLVIKAAVRATNEANQLRCSNALEGLKIATGLVYQYEERLKQKKLTAAAIADKVGNAWYYVEKANAAFRSHCLRKRGRDR